MSASTCWAVSARIASRFDRAVAAGVDEEDEVAVLSRGVLRAGEHAPANGVVAIWSEMRPTVRVCCVRSPRATELGA